MALGIFGEFDMLNLDFDSPYTPAHELPSCSEPHHTLAGPIVGSGKLMFL